MKKKYLLCFGICLVAACGTPNRVPITPAEAEAITGKILRMWNSGDLSLTDELFTPDYVRHHPIPAANANLEDLKHTVVSNRKNFPDYHLVFNEMILNSDKIMVTATMTGTHTGLLGEIPATGKKVHMDGIYIFRIVDQKIAEEWTYFNLLSYYQQLGYALVPPSD